MTYQSMTYATLPLGSNPEDFDWLDDCEIDFTVSFWGSPAQLSGPPEFCSPAEPAEYECTEVRTPEGELLLFDVWVPAERRWDEI
jgi:hypothetical protein